MACSGDQLVRDFNNLCKSLEEHSERAARCADHPSRSMFLQWFGGFHERGKRAELVLREKSINLIDFIATLPV
jgi:hypothetical protein